jgi:hypothetical protein
MRLSAYVNGIGVLGPNLASWPDAAAVLTGRRAYVPAPTWLPPSTLLPPAERRRIGRVVKLALAVASEATAHAGTAPTQLASVFSSSGGDGHNCHALCEALAQPNREVSPTRFSNSVHNAAAGYWSIATGSTREANVICACDASFGAGLLEAMTQVAVDGESVLLVAYDTEYPEPIRAKRPVPDAFGVALVLSPSQQSHSLVRVDAMLGETLPDTLANPALEALRLAIPAARSLPFLLQAASRESGTAVLDYLDAVRLVLNVAPCAAEPV